jgi:hypothetical protein
MATAPRGYLKKEVQLIQQKTSQGVRLVSGQLDGTTTSEIIKLGTVAEQISVQTTGTLVINFDVSINGTDYVGITAASAASIATYSTSLAVSVRLTRTAGAGTAVIVAR